MSNPKNLILQRCPSCEIVKTAAEFNKGARSNGLSSYCKDCNNIKHVCKTYGISPKVYEHMQMRADGFCEMCGNKPKRFVVDHSHETGKVRGLICDGCNQFLGHIEGKLNIIYQAENYLAKFR